MSPKVNFGNGCGNTFYQASCPPLVLEH